MQHWLDQHDLGKYAELFAEHAIDIDIVQYLSERQIEQFGLPMGDRVRLQRAIAAMAGAASGFGDSSFEAGRRQLSVMFCDLVGSTALSQGLDPEDYGHIIRRFMACATAAVARYEGHVARYMGDALMVYFGFPLAHEDDAERAIRCGLEIVSAVRSLEPGHKLQLHTRVGIATGLAVVGEVVGAGASLEHTALGNTPNLAARLQAAAEPDSVVVSAATKRLVEGRLDLELVGELTLKGFAEPVVAYKATELRESGRLRTLTRQRLDRFVGRAKELQSLYQHWEQAAQGQGQVLLLGGEPGIGKSLMAEALRERLRAEPHLCIRYQCKALHVHSPFHPVIAQLGQAAGLAQGDSADAVLDKLEALLQGRFAGPQLKTSLALLAALLSIEQLRWPMPAMTPRQERAATIALLQQMIRERAQHMPLLLLVEDGHWIDPSTREFLDALVSGLATVPVMLLVTYRPPFECAWRGAANVTDLVLQRMSGEESEAIVRQLTGEQDLPPQVLAQIVERTDGIPFFVEEMTRSVLESRLGEPVHDGAVPPRPPAALAVPSTLQDSLMARLDRLGPARAVAQIGAAIGREFSYQLLAASAQMDGQALDAAMQRLMTAELVFRRGQAPDVVYAFNHALVRDAAYDSLLHKRRQELHGRIGGVLEDQFSQSVVSEPELLAHHFAKAGLSSKALKYWRFAGSRSYRRSAIVEAVSHYSQALELVPKLEDSSQRLELEVSLLTELGEALMLSKGFTAPEVRGLYERAEMLARGIDDTQRALKVLFGLWAYQHVRADMPKARVLAERLCSIGKQINDQDEGLSAMTVLGITTHCNGELALSRQTHEHVVEHYRFDAERARARPLVNDPGAMSRTYLASTLWYLGHPEQALRTSAQALDHARAIAHPYTLATVLALTARFHQIRRDLERTLALATETIAVSTEFGFPIWRTLGNLLVSWVRAERGDAKGALQMQAAIGVYRTIGVGISLPYYRALHAEQQARRGHVEEALATLGEALAETALTGAHTEEAEIRRIEGEILRLRGAHASALAEQRLREALALAGRQGALALRLRCASSLARLLRDDARISEARETLEGERSRFTEGFGADDLQAADALLAELG